MDEIELYTAAEWRAWQMAEPWLGRDATPRDAGNLLIEVATRITIERARVARLVEPAFPPEYPCRPSV